MGKTAKKLAEVATIVDSTMCGKEKGLFPISLSLSVK